MPAAVTSPADVHVVINYQSGVADTADTATKLASALRARGINHVDINPVGYAVSINQVKFFHGPDAEQATSIGRVVTSSTDPQGRALSFQMNDLSKALSTAEPGRVEIWLGGGG
jgi:hypothetical protein